MGDVVAAHRAPPRPDHLGRLDEVVGGFLTFARPDQLTLAPVFMHSLIDDMLPVISAEAGKTGVKIDVECPPDLPPVLGDAGLVAVAVFGNQTYFGRLRVQQLGWSLLLAWCVSFVFYQSARALGW